MEVTMKHPIQRSLAIASSVHSSALMPISAHSSSCTSVGWNCAKAKGTAEIVTTANNAIAAFTTPCTRSRYLRYLLPYSTYILPVWSLT